MRDILPRFLTFIGIATLFLTAICCLSSESVGVLLFALLGYVLVSEWPQFQRPCLTILYPVMPFLALIFLNFQQYRLELLWLFVIIAAHDTGAYLVGQLCGVHKIMPAVSPGKSWEGIIGGYLISCIASLFFVFHFSGFSFIAHFSLLFHCIIVLLLNICGVVGDFVESAFKRSVHIKDSGTLLPGHGGVLDRLDSMLFAVPAWLVIRFILYTFIL